MYWRRRTNRKTVKKKTNFTRVHAFNLITSTSLNWVFLTLRFSIAIDVHGGEIIRDQIVVPEGKQKKQSLQQ